MPKRQNTPAEIPPITDFESCQRARSALFRRLTDQLEIFRVCPNRTCKRMRACQDARGACFHAKSIITPRKFVNRHVVLAELVDPATGAELRADDDASAGDERGAPSPLGGGLACCRLRSPASGGPLWLRGR